MRLRIAFRADASLTIGGGHVMRCIALADELRRAGHQAWFMSRPAPGDLRDVVTKHWGFDMIELPAADPSDSCGADAEANDARRTLAMLARNPADWVVVDHYDLEATWETQIAAAGPQVLAIDDLAQRPHACALVLDQNLVPEDIYPTTLHDGLLSGPRYALLRTEFATMSPERPLTNALRTILISFGGADPTDQTTKALAALEPHLTSLDHVIVISGHAHPNLTGLRAIARDEPKVELHDRVNDMATLLGKADLAIGAGGVSALERLAIGVPAIVVTTAANQEGPAKALAKEGALLYLGPADSVDAPSITTAVATLRNPHLRHAMRQRGRALVDGHGPRRVARAMIRRTHVTIRTATPADGAWMHDWRNDPRIRTTAFDTEPIPRATHDAWLERVLADPDRHLLVAEAGTEPAGVLRYDVNRAAGTAEISIYLAPHLLGAGLGHAVLTAGDAWLIGHDASVRRIVAQARTANTASLRLFEGAGYSADRTILHRSIVHPAIERATAHPPNPHGGS